MIKITFTVDEDFTKEDLIRTIHADKAYYKIDCITNIFRSIYKYNTIDNEHGMPIKFVEREDLTEEEMELVEKIEKRIFSILEDLPERY